MGFERHKKFPWLGKGIGNPVQGPLGATRSVTPLIRRGMVLHPLVLWRTLKSFGWSHFVFRPLQHIGRWGLPLIGLITDDHFLKQNQSIPIVDRWSATALAGQFVLAYVEPVSRVINEGRFELIGSLQGWPAAQSSQIGRALLDCSLDRCWLTSSLHCNSHLQASIQNRLACQSGYVWKTVRRSQGNYEICLFSAGKRSRSVNEWIVLSICHGMVYGSGTVLLLNWKDKFQMKVKLTK